jgi:acylphosphatase
MEYNYIIRITGKVQGVGYRHNAAKVAYGLGIMLNIRNEADGSVFAEATGREEDVIIFLNWCKHGPQRAIVQDVEVLQKIKIENKTRN